MAAEDLNPKATETVGDAENCTLDGLEKLAVRDRAQAGRLVRAHDEPGFILAVWPWSEMSVIASVFTRKYGRVTLTVRGAKRPGTRFRGLINPFYPLKVSFSGRGEVKNLTDVKWLGGLTPLSGRLMLSAYYLNELMLCLTAREDPSPALFDAYTQALTALVHQESAVGEMRVLRTFEANILDISGWGPAGKDAFSSDWWTVADGEIVPAVYDEGNHSQYWRSEVIDCIIRRDFENEDYLRPAREVLRSIISYHAGNARRRGLESRRTLQKWTAFLTAPIPEDLNSDNRSEKPEA